MEVIVMHANEINLFLLISGTKHDTSLSSFAIDYPLPGLRQ
jgi:hypothetical protein